MFQKFRYGLLVVATMISSSASSQGMTGVDMTLPKMTEAQMTRGDVEHALRQATAEAPADFSRVWLNGLDLSGLDFSGANLRAASMNGVNLSGANLDRAVLSQAWMIDANLEGASLKGAELFQTQMRGANLSHTDFTGARAAADFSKALLDGAVFRGADFSADMRNQSMGLMRGVLTSARGANVDFTGAMMSRADMEFARFPGANFEGADMSMVTMGGADLTGANVTGVNFMDADVISTRLVDLVGVEQSNLETARHLERAIR